MSYVLSLLIVVPLLGSIATYLAGRWDRRGAIYTSLGVSLITLALILYVYAAVYANPPALGAYALTEKYTWFSGVRSR